MSVQNQALLRAISEDRALGSAMLFSHRHEYRTPDFHVQVMDLWRSADEFVMIEAFREGAKTTLSEEFLTMEGAFGNFFYCILFGETYAKACQKIEAIAFEAKTNHKLAKLFGGKVLARKPIENKIWFSSGALIEAAGWEQEITGFKYLDRRPDRAYLDDVENLERVRSTEAVDAGMQKLYREVLPAMDKKRRRVRFTETPRAADCMVTRLRSNPDWLCASFPICNGDLDDARTVSAWPDRYPMQWIRAERDRYARAGMLRQFQQEYMLTVDTGATKPFDESMIRSVDVAPAAWLPRVPIYDPSRTANPEESDRTGKVVVSRLGSKIIVHESGGYFWKPDEIRADVFAAIAKHKASEVAIEKNSLDEFLLQPIRYEMIKHGVVFELRALQAPQDRDKEAFIMGLEAFFKAGDIVLVGGRGMHPQLVAEMLNFPGGRLDILNALAYALRVFSGQPVYEDFGEANIAPAPGLTVADKIAICWMASANEVVAVGYLVVGRHRYVVGDWIAAGPLSDAVKSVLSQVRVAHPRVRMEHWAPSELHDSFSRVPLVPALRAERLSPWRGEHTVLARGSLSEAVRTTIREKRLLTVDKSAVRTLAALAGGYRYPLARVGAKNAPEPEAGIARLAAEALESAEAMISRGIGQDGEKEGHFAVSTGGARYRTALPQRRG